MIGRVTKNPITNCCYAETLAGPTGGTVQKLGLCDDCDYEVVLSAGDRDVDGESYVGVSTCCPVTYNPDTGTFKVCVLEANSVNGNIDASRIKTVCNDDSAGYMVPFITNTVSVNGTDYSEIGRDACFLFNPSTNKLESGIVSLNTLCVSDKATMYYRGTNLVLDIYESSVCWNCNGCYFGNVCGTACCALNATCANSSCCACIACCAHTAPYTIYSWRPLVSAVTNCVGGVTNTQLAQSCQCTCGGLLYSPSFKTNYACFGNDWDICLYDGNGNEWVCWYQDGGYRIGIGSNSYGCDCNAYCGGIVLGNGSCACYSATAIGNYTLASPCAVAVGTSAKACCSQSAAIGTCSCSNSLGVAVGFVAEACCKGVSIGYDTVACNRAVAIGADALANDGYTILGYHARNYSACGITIIPWKIGPRTFMYTMCIPTGTQHCAFQKFMQCAIRNVLCYMDDNGGINHTYRATASHNGLSDSTTVMGGGYGSPWQICGQSVNCSLVMWDSDHGGTGTFTCTDTANSWFSCGCIMNGVIQVVG